MSETKHTPAPWHWEYVEGLRKRLTTYGSDVFTAALTDDDFSYVDIDEPDANLIAAAPDLLEACEAGFNALYDIIQSEFATSSNPHLADSDPDVVQMRAAIAKAKGEEKPSDPADMERFKNEVRAAIEGDK